MKFQLLLRSLVCATLILVAGTTKATNFYVDPSTTSSTQNGTLANPWKTISQVQSNMSSFNAGDFIYFKKGETFTINSTLNITRSGTASAPITFATYGTSANAPLFTGSASDLFNIDSRNYIVFDGFKITDLTLDPDDRNQEAIIDRAFAIDGSTYITVKNCDISLVGVGINMVGNYCTMDHCTISNLRMIRNTQGGDDDYGANPVVISGSNNSITANYFNGCWAYSYDYTYDGGAIEVYGANNNSNKIMYNTAINCDGFMEIGYDGGGSSDNNMVAYNKIINCGELVYISNSGTYSTTVNNLEFFNNVIVHTVNQLTMPTSMIGMSASSSTANIVNLKNNIFWLTTGIDVARSGKFSGSQLTHEDNIYHLGTGSVLNFTLSSSELSTTSTIFTSTSGSDPSVWNYVPTTGSPAIDFGQNLGLAKDFAGNTVPSVPNAGILESSSGSSTLAAASTAGTISCNGGTTTVTVTATGGTAPYTGTGTFTVSAGTYTYTVTDAAGTTKTTSITISQPSALTVTLSAGVIGVYGGTTSVTATAAGGTGAYTYKLNSGSYQSANSFSGVAAGTHTVTVKDANGCTGTKTITITQPAQVPPLVAASTGGPISCNGGTTTVTVTATGGTAPYSGTGTFTVSAGTHNYTVTDANALSATTSVTIAEPSAIVVTLSSGVIIVYGGTTTITVMATGGTGGYTYKLNAGLYQSGNSFSGVFAGTHSINVKDANGCISTNTITITQPAALTATATAGTISCNGGTTSVMVSASGGTTPYTGTGTFTVSAGTQNYIVTDANGQTATTSITVTQPALITIGVSSGTIGVYGGTTSVMVNAGGGTGAYTYQLDAGSYQSSNTFNGVGAGNHTVTVKDANGCTSIKNFTLTQPPPTATLTASANATSINCNGGSAVITVTATGGTSPYTGTGTFTAGAGTYNYTVTDAAGATASASVSITQPSAIEVTVSSGTIAIYGGTTSVTVAATGGTGAYSYNLDAASYQVSNTFTGVAAGNHSVTVKDANGCTSVKNFTITQPEQNTIVITATATPINCNGDISTITVSASGGTAPYTGTGLSTGYAGTYSYTVTDASGATSTISLTITQPAGIVVTVSAGTITQTGGTTTATVNATGGTAPYTYSLNGAVYQATNSFLNVPAGSHTVTVKDAHGCTSVKAFTISVPGSPNFRISLVTRRNADCHGGNSGYIKVQATGGRAPYTYQLNNGRFTSTSEFSNLVAGFYRINAKDANGSIVTLVTYIFDGRSVCTNTGSNAGRSAGRLNVNTYPNPSSDRFSLNIESENQADVIVEVINFNGKKVFEEKGSVYKKYVFGEYFTPGTYFIRVIQGKDIKTQKLVKIN